MQPDNSNQMDHKKQCKCVLASREVPLDFLTTVNILYWLAEKRYKCALASRQMSVLALYFLNEA